MSKRWVALTSVACVCLLLSGPRPAGAASRYNRTYAVYYEQGKAAFESGDYEKALLYFEAALSADPSQKAPLKYLHLIRRFHEGRIKQIGGTPQGETAVHGKSAPSDKRVTPPPSSAPFPAPTKKTLRLDWADLEPYLETQPEEKDVKAPSAPEKKEGAPVKEASVQTPVSRETHPSRSSPLAPESEKKSLPSLKDADTGPTEKKTFPRKLKPIHRAVPVPQPQGPAQTKPLKTTEGRDIPGRSADVVPERLELNDETWASQPNAVIELEINKPLILSGNRVRRYLAVTPNVLHMERLNKDEIKIGTEMIAETFVHVWDEKGRWTFRVMGVSPNRAAIQKTKEIQEQSLEEARPFKVAYTNNWLASYTGNSIPDLARQNLTFTQWVGTFGETPFGDFDASMNFFKFAESTERVGQRMGLTNGHIGPFKDFRIRGWDTNTSFSELSLPGRSYRGILLDAYAFHRRIRYQYVQGQDRAEILFLTPGNATIRRSFLEGAEVTFFPEGKHMFSLNYARGWGEARENFLKSKVMSLDTRHRLGDWQIETEVGFDGDAYAKLIKSRWIQEKGEFRLNLHDIERDYVTISSQPTDQGEVGGDVIWRWRTGPYRLYSNIEIYKDRRIFNPDNRNGVNVDGNFSLSRSLSESLEWNMNAFGAFTPQLLSERRTLSVGNTLTRRFRLGKTKFLSAFAGLRYQVNRFPDSPASEFDRLTFTGGVRLPLIRGMNFFANYEYSWAHDVLNDSSVKPRVLDTGLSYVFQPMKTLTVSLNLTYRDEESTEGNFAFLSGQDDMRAGMSVSYHPRPDFEVFVDGSVRNVWSEASDSASFNDASVRFGVRSSWDTPFRWNPSATIQGSVYKDSNGDGRKDEGEKGVGGIGVLVGDSRVETDDQGHFEKRIHAKKVKIRLDMNSLPKGFLITGDVIQEVAPEQGKVYQVDFPLNARAGIYGVIFHDRNDNGTYDFGEPYLQRVRVVLDGEKFLFTDFEGVYFFDNISAGRHTVELDIKTVPIQYIPKVKLKRVIELEEGSTYIYHIPLRKK